MTNSKIKNLPAEAAAQAGKKITIKNI